MGYLNPFAACPSGGLELYREYVKSRPDRNFFLGHVARSSVLVCDCWAEVCSCHAQILRELVTDSNVAACNVESYCEDWEDCDVLVCGSCDDADSMVDEVGYPNKTWNNGSFLESVNETVRANAIGSRPKYPRVWTQLIDHVRSFQTLLFWEIFAGSAVLTGCMQEVGWYCASPLDILFHPDYDLLNPLFMAIVIGLILEGRF